MHSIWFLGMLIVGGMGSTVGAIFGVVFLRALEEGTKILGTNMIGLFPTLVGSVQAALTVSVYGIVIILFLIYEPRGLAHRWEMFKASYRLRPFAY